MQEEQEKILNFMHKMKRPCNPFHAESLSNIFDAITIKICLNRLSESGYIIQTEYPNNGFSVSLS